MTRHYNKSTEKEKRRSLRNNSTYGEKLLWVYIRKRQVCDERFLREYSVDKYVIDFYCPDLHLAIEIDGPTHFENNEAIEYDRRRQSYLENYNIKFLRYTDDEVKGNLDKVLKKIEEEVIKRQKEKQKNK
ncbi:MAG: endonuclease domain-containing protein [Ignavibacteriales bacterium]|nr:endonuclease domain-containing protein [Ignavibacteriales bacterium]